LDLYTRALLVSKDVRHLFVIPWSEPPVIGMAGWQLQ
jgi:hypothetical protein